MFASLHWGAARARFQRGHGKVKALTWLSLAACLIFAVAQAVVAFLSHISLVEALKVYAGDDLLRANYPLQANLVREVQAIDPEFAAEALYVEYSPRRDAVRIEFPYQRPVDLKIATVSVPLTANFIVSRAAEKPKIDNVVRAFENSYSSNAAANRVRRELDAVQPKAP